MTDLSFDDLIPSGDQAAPARAALSFDDLVPAAAPAAQAAADDGNWPTAAGRAVQRGVLQAGAIPGQIRAGAAAGIAGDIGRSFDDIYAEEVAHYGPEPLPQDEDQARQSAQTRFDMAQSSDRDEQIQRGAEGLLSASRLRERAAAIPRSGAGARFAEAFDAKPDTWASVFSSVRDDPVGAAAFLGETVLESAAPVAAGTAATVLTRNPAVGIGAMGATDFALEASSSAADFLAQKGVQVRTPEDAAAVMENAGLMREAQKVGATRGMVIALMDMVSGGIATKELLKGPVKDFAAQTAVQAGAGSGGEALGQLASGQDLSPKNIAIEGLAEGVTAPAEVYGVARDSLRDPREEHAAPPAAALDVPGETPARPMQPTAQAPRPDLPVTPDQLASPIQTPLLQEGQAVLDAVAKGEPIPDVPLGAVSAETLFGKPEEDEAGSANPAPDYSDPIPEVSTPAAEPTAPAAPGLVSPERAEEIKARLAEKLGLAAPVSAPETAIPAAAPEAAAEPALAAPASAQRRAKAPSVQKKPFTYRFKALGIEPGGPVAAELAHAGITAQNTPGLFKRGGLSDVDNLPASEWQDIAHEIGVDGQYLSRQGVIDALVREAGGQPVRSAEQQAVADQKAALDERKERLGNATTYVSDRRTGGLRLSDEEGARLSEKIADSDGDPEDVIESFLLHEVENAETPDDAIDSRPAWGDDIPGWDDDGWAAREDEGDPGPSWEGDLEPAGFAAPEGDGAAGGGERPGADGQEAPAVKTNIFGLPVGVTFDGREKVSASGLKAGDWIQSDGKAMQVRAVAQKGDGYALTLNHTGGTGTFDVSADSKVERYIPARTGTLEGGAVDLTPEGLQTVIPGAERAPDRVRGEREMGKPLRGGNAAMQDDGLFGDPGNRGDLFDDLVVSAQGDRAATDASDAQKEAGNYRKGHVKLHGLDITIENAKGSTRRGKAPDGTEWSVEMPATYGYIRKTTGADGDHVDVYVGDTPNSDLVVIVNQVDPESRKFDEHKVILGATSSANALRLYEGGFSDGSGKSRLGSFTVTTVDGFKNWLRNANTTVPTEPIRDFRPFEPVKEPKIGGAKAPETLEVSGSAKTSKLDRKPLGKNADGNEVFEDGRGVRSYVRDGVRVSEKVALDPRGGVSVNTSERGPEFEPAAEPAPKSTFDSPRAYNEALIAGIERRMRMGGQVVLGGNYLKTVIFKKPGSADAALRVSPDGLDLQIRERGKWPSLIGTQVDSIASQVNMPPREATGLEFRNATLIKMQEDAAARRKARDAVDDSFDTDEKATEAEGWRDEIARAARLLGGREDPFMAVLGKNMPEATYEETRQVYDRMKGLLDSVENVFEPKSEAAPRGPRVIVNKLGPDGLTDDERAAGKAPYNEPEAERPMPRGHTLGSARKMTKAEADRSAGDPDAGNGSWAKGDFHAVVSRERPWAAFGGYGKTRAEAINAAIARAERAAPKTDAVRDADAIRKGELPVEDDRERQRRENVAKMEERRAAPAPAAYGSANRLVSKDRAAELREKLKAKLRDQLNAGIDPEILAIGAELSVFHIEAGARSFTALVQAVANDLGTTPAKIRPYLRAWYNGARDMLEDAGQSIEGMDGPDEVRAILNNPVFASLEGQKVRGALAETDKPAEAKPEPKPEPAAPDLAITDLQDSTPTRDREKTEKLAAGFRTSFAAGERFATIVQARKRASEILGEKLGEGDAKMIEEAIEAGVVMRAREIVADASGVRAYDQLVDLYAAQPILGTRTSTSVEQQAYSTPAPLAYLASRLAGITRKTTVYEPTAGNGMLLIGARPANILANELNPDRFANLKAMLPEATLRKGDATEFTPDRKVDVVIGNPPFAKVQGENGKAKRWDLGGRPTTEIDHAIAWKALQSMSDGGKAVFIIGGHRGTDEERKAGYRIQLHLAFMAKLYDAYNVTEHFTVDGDLYRRQGAGWPVDVIVIEGRGRSSKPLPSAIVPTMYSSWEDLRSRLDATDSLDTRPERAGDGDRPAAPAPAETADAGAVPSRPVRSDRPADSEGNAGAGEGDTRPDRGAGESEPAVSRPGGRGAGGERAPAGAVRGERPVSGPAVETDARPEGGRPAGSGDAGGVRERPDGVRPGRVERQNTEAETAFQVQYAPTSNAKFAVGTLVPKNMQAAISRALADLEGRVGDIDDYVGGKLGYTRDELLGSDKRQGYFSAEQVDALALAIDNVENDSGFIIGDQTGVGKGRFVAAMIRYGIQNGRPPIFVTKAPGLYADMVRDLRDIGMPDIAGRILVSNNGLRGDQAIPLSADVTDVLQSLPGAKQGAAIKKIVATGSLPGDAEAFFTTYSQMQYKAGSVGIETDRQLAMRALAPQGLIIMDESHEAGGSESKRIDPATGEEVPTRADFFRAMLQETRGAIYSSATYAKNPTVMSLYFKTDLSVAVENMEDLAGAIQAGGVPLQQAVANMLVEAGQYARRERSYEGVEMNLDVLPTNDKMGRAASEALRNVFSLDQDFMEAVRQSYIDEAAGEGDSGGRDGAIGEGSAGSTNFASIMHVVVSQMLLSLKAKATVDKAIALHRAGEKPIIALSNTNASIISDYVDEAGLKVGDRADLTFNAILNRYLRRLRRITLKDPNGDKRHVYLTDAQILEHGGPDALEEFHRVEAMVRDIDLSEMPASPIDYIVDRLAAEGIKAGEITGRQVTLRGGAYSLRDSSDAAKKREMNAFNAGGLDALVINRSGSTGFSLHAQAREGNDGKKRHMIVLQPDPNIDTFMQMLGRIHRTGQIKLPGYTIGVSDLAIEKRLAAVLMRKMASLNANTTASKKSAVSLDNVTDFLNRYGDQVVAEYLRENDEVANLVGLNASVSEGLAAKFTGRLAILPPEQVAVIYDEIEASYREMIETLDRMGMNALEAKTLDLDARTIESAALVEAKEGIDSPFAEGAVIETMDVKKLGKPMTSGEVDAEVEKAAGGKGTIDYVTERTRKLDEAMPVFLAKIEAGKARATQAGVDAKTDKQKDKAADALRRWTATEEMAQERLRTVKDAVETYAPGEAFILSVKEGEAETTAYAVSLGTDLKAVKDNPTAASAVKVRFAIADAGREVVVPLSKLIGSETGVSATPLASAQTTPPQGRPVGTDVGQMTLYAGDTVSFVRRDDKGFFIKGPDGAAEGTIVGATAGGFTVRPTSYDGRDLRFPPTGDVRLVSSKARESDSRLPSAVRKAFDDGQSEAREKRQIITGNILAGFAAFKKGRITMFTDSTGAVRQGIVMPKDFNAESEMSKRPVVFKDPAHVARFLAEDAGKRMVKTSDDKLAITANSMGEFSLRVTVNGGKPYYLNQAVRALIGGEGFTRRGGQKTMSAIVRSAKTLTDIVRAFQENLGAIFHTTASKDEARAITGEKAYGETNTVVTKGEAEQLRARRDEKFRTELNAGVDPESVKIAGKLAAYHAEATARKVGRSHLLDRALDVQPIDYALRAPFGLVGGLDAQGRWNPGLKLTQKGTTALTSAKFSEAGRFSFLNPLLEKARAGLIDRYGLDPHYVERERVRGLDERRILAEVPELMAVLKDRNVGAAEAKVLQAVLTGEAVADADMAKLAEPIRQAIDEMGQEAVMLGLISPESFERNRGAYLHRVYMKDEGDAGGLTRMASQFMTRRRRKIVGDQFKGRGLFEQISVDRLMRHIPGYAEGIVGRPQKGDTFRMLDLVSRKASADLDGTERDGRTLKRVWIPADVSVPPAFADWTDRGVWEVRGGEGNNLTLWRDFSKEERGKMGEIVDARYTIAKTYMMMARDLATGRFFKDIAANEEWSRGAPPPDGTWKEAGEYSRFWADPDVAWVRVPETKISKSNTHRYGSLAGRFVRAEIWRDLEEMEALNKPSLWRSLLTQWKLNKTARSPVVHMNNVMSNFMLLDMAGVTHGDLVRAVREMRRGGPIYREAVEHGAFGTDMVAQEIRENELKPLLDEIVKDMQGAGTVEAGMRTSPMLRSIALIGKILDSAWGLLRRADKKMTSLYQAEDEVFRMATYLRRRKQGLAANEAALDARDQFMNYDIRAPWVNAARRTVLPFIAYTYRAVPIVAKTIATRPWKLAKYFAITYALNALAYAMAPSDDDEETERKSLRENERGHTWVGTPRMVRAPWLDEFGRPVFVDIRRWIPASDVFDLGQGSAAIDMPAWLQLGGPLMMGAELLLNRSAFTGDDIVNDLTDTGGEKVAKVGDYLWKTWLPSAAWIPSSWYWEKIANAATGATDAKGRDYSVPQALLSSVGIKVKPQDVEEAQYWQAFDFDKVERELEKQGKAIGRQRDRNLISDAEYEKQMEKIGAKMDRLNERRDETLPR